MATVEPGAVVGGRYQLEKPIGAGGMAKVWLAHDRLLDRQVAVKILAERYASDPDFVERFRREASAAAGLSHPNIVTVFDRGEAEGSYYIVMEHLPGPDLKAVIRQRGALAPRQAVDAALQVLAALSAAHRRNVIHRDIKPQNVLIAEDGHLKVTDFGIARAGDDAGMTDVGSVIGTAQYLSPEQARGEDVTTASDCYSVGIVLYELLTGRVPFDGEKPVAIAMRQINEVPVAPRVLVPQIPPQLNDIVMKALQKRPGSRYRTAEEFTDALLAVRPTLPEPVEDATQVLAAVESPATTRIIAQHTAATRVAPRQNSMPPPPPRRRRRGPILIALLALLLLAGAAAAFLFTDIGRAAKVPVPQVAGQTEAGATTALRNAGFEVDPEQRIDATTTRGKAIETDPGEGTKVAKGETITLFVSSGPETGEVPNLVGKIYDDAASELRQANFVPVREDVFSDKPVDEVVGQNRGAGETIDRGTTVTLSVSKGQDLVDVPDVVRENEGEAKRLLEEAGLELGNVRTRETTKRSPGTVLAQDPRGGRTPRGSAVNIVVAKAPTSTTITMPDVTGNGFEAARQKLRDAGFADPTSNTEPDSAPEGTVIRQFPAPNTQVDPTTTTPVIVVSSGPAAAPVDPGAQPDVPAP